MSGPRQQRTHFPNEANPQPIPLRPSQSLIGKEIIRHHSKPLKKKEGTPS